METRPERKRVPKPIRAPREKKKRAAPDPKAVARAYLDAFGRKQFGRLEKLLHPDIDFRGPSGSLRGAREFIAALRRMAPILLRTKIKRIFVEGDEAFVRYDLVTATPVGPVPTVELLKIENGRVRSTWLLFDQQAWSAALREAAGRAAD